MVLADGLRWLWEHKPSIAWARESMDEEEAPLPRRRRRSIALHRPAVLEEEDESDDEAYEEDLEDEDDDEDLEEEDVEEEDEDEDEDEDEEDAEEEDDEEEIDQDDEPPRRARRSKMRVQRESKKPAPRAKRVAEPSEREGIPPLSLLDLPQSQRKKPLVSDAMLEGVSEDVESCLAEFGVEADVVAIYPGPVITRYELELAPGIKVSKLTGLSKDLARSLSVVSVRIVEVIPGKSVVGLEIPNQYREIVRLREVLTSEAYQHARSPLSLVLGKDIAGEPVVVDLAKMPHLLVAGTTGSGKSVGLNAMLLSILYKAVPEEVRMILIDPKMLELSVYDVFHIF